MSLTKKFERYIPEEEHYSNVIYLRNVDGDWYKQQANFKNNTLKILYDDDGVITSMHHDVSMLYPEGAYILELDPQTEVDIDIHRVKNGQLFEYQTKNEINALQNEAQKKILLAEAGNIIDTLQDAIDLGLATDEEIEKLKEWKVYRIQLNRIDTSTAPDIEWPVKP
ncbi:tail fiber assembly protein [Providencia rustigianii]|uniref:Caudovirales tail fiber assembly protein n=1 Tax=Providencia rustigianii DSM 4541 TaxID=500637 RepID=D1NZR7_9GAMM|nr:tail fiber assembly protein [Providencia rustigianii]EFB73333.1 caudovirales tail fiber assembly protein [Providencia rustigianii DSM 4541]